MSWGGTLTLRKLLIGFNISLLLTFLLSIALPLLFLGSDVISYFQNNKFGIGIMLLSFIAINSYFAYNWHFFCCLERGDWYTLLYWLRKHIFEKKQYKKKYVFYFIEVAIQLNNLELLRELFEELQEKARLLHSPFYHNAGHSSHYSNTHGKMKGKARNKKNYKLAVSASKCLCIYAIEFGLPYLIDDPENESEESENESEVYFGNLRDCKDFQKPRYRHKYQWAKLFYAIALLVQGKLKFAADVLEELLLPQQTNNSLKRILGRKYICENALIQLVSIQLLEDLQEHLTKWSSDNPFTIDEQLLDIRRKEIQKIYGSPKHWSSYLLKEQNQNIAIVMIRQLISKAYEKQLRPAHQAYLTNRTPPSTKPAQPSLHDHR